MNTIRDGWRANPGISTRSAESIWYISPCDPPTGPKVLPPTMPMRTKISQALRANQKCCFVQKTELSTMIS